MQNVEEVFNLKSAVLGQVGAVNSVFALVATENCTQGFWTDRTCELGVVGSAKLSQGGDYIFLSNFKGYAGSIRKFLDNLIVFWYNSFIYF